MAYGVKIELIGRSAVFKKKWKVQIAENGYIGAVVGRNVPSASPFVWRKDSAETIRGTSFEFAIRSSIDFEFLDLYTADTKKYKVTLFNENNAEVWVGFNLPEQYQEPYAPAPYNIRFTASDQLGLLKEIQYNPADGRKTELQIIDECLDYCGLDLGYCISIAISEVRQAASRSALGEISVEASIFRGRTCYEVIESILSAYNATITQHGCRWYITDSIKTAARLYYSAACVYESAGTAIPAVVLGQYNKAGTVLYPTGSPLEMTLATSYKTLKITDDFGTRTDMLPASTADAWENAFTLPNWEKFGTHPTTSIYRQEIGSDICIWLTGNISFTSNQFGMRTTIPNIEQTTDAYTFSFDFSSTVDTEIFFSLYLYLQIRIYIVDTEAIRYLGPNGWTQDYNTRFLLSSIPKAVAWSPSWSNFKTTFSGIPITGTLYVEISVPHVLWKTFNAPGGVLVKNVSMVQLTAEKTVQPLGEVRTVTLNASSSAQTKNITLWASDVPLVANAKLIFRNYTTLSDGALTGQWYTADIGSDNLRNVLTKVYASDNRRAKQVLKGRIRGEQISFDHIVQVNYPYSRTFEFTEFSYDLIADAVDVTLSEILDYEEVGYSIVDVANSLAEAPKAPEIIETRTDWTIYNLLMTMLRVVKVPFISSMPTISNWQIDQVDPEDSTKSINFSTTFGENPNIRLIITLDASNRYQRQQMPKFTYVDDLIDTVFFDLGEEYTGYLLISRQ